MSITVILNKKEKLLALRRHHQINLDLSICIMYVCKKIIKVK